MYLISYDLRKVKNYSKLYECLNQWKAQRLLESLWVAHVQGTSNTIRQILMNCVDGDDSLVVIELPAGIDWATQRARPGGIALLRALSSMKAA
jgi:hypothetical protein